MKKFAILVLALLALGAAVAQADTITNALGQVYTRSGSEGAYAVMTTTVTTNYVTYRAGINVYYDTNVVAVTASTAYSNACSIGDLLVGTYSNKVWVLTRMGVFTLLN